MVDLYLELVIFLLGWEGVEFGDLCKVVICGDGLVVLGCAEF